MWYAAATRIDHFLREEFDALPSGKIDEDIVFANRYRTVNKFKKHKPKCDVLDELTKFYAPPAQ